ncbi:MAG: secondary thiamine-phosphate synthase enzyme YjbQ [Candidatus Dormibacteraeota bacterium]|nr:secondary thiamine-phosphate synthase enzyme YjbQ [Candidatus Dormibacteraeota bacterium]
MEGPPGRTLAIQTSARAEALNITKDVEAVVTASGIEDGICVVFVPHTTAAVFLNENADPDALADILSTLDRMVPWEAGYRHAEGNAAAHIKASLVGTSETIPVEDGRLSLGRWQGIFFAEFDGPRRRECRVSVQPK